MRKLNILLIMSLVVQFAFAQSNSGSVRQNNNLRMRMIKISLKRVGELHL